MISKLMASIFTPPNPKRILAILFYRWSHFNSNRATMQVLGRKMDAEYFGFSSELDAA